MQIASVALSVCSPSEKVKHEQTHLLHETSYQQERQKYLIFSPPLSARVKFSDFNMFWAASLCEQDNFI
jgi:hypothetical protein